MAEYANVQKGALKLKGVSDGGIKKKKKKKDKQKRILEQISSHTEAPLAQDDKTHAHTQEDRRTKAELAFAQVKEKRAAQELIEKASKTHKERILEFNKQLDNLTEHFDIPKVSWTK